MRGGVTYDVVKNDPLEVAAELPTSRFQLFLRRHPHNMIRSQPKVGL
jgi:hypothetical protein